MTPSSPATRMVARSPEDLVAIAPLVLGFVPDDSVVMLMFEGAKTFHARLDMPPPGEVDAGVRSMLRPALRHGARRVVLLLYGDGSPHVADVGRAFVAAFEGEGVQVVQAVRVDGQRCYPLLPGSAAVPEEGAVYDLTAHRFTAQAVLDGRVTHRSREALAATLDRDPARVAAVAAHVASPAPSGSRAAVADWAAELVRRHAANGTLPDDEESARLLVAVGEEEVCDAVLGLLRREEAASHVALWTELVRRSPDPVLPAAAALLGFAAWVSGHGALAWCAVDVCVGIEPDHRLAGLLAALLTEAVPPSEWEPARLAAG